MNERYLGLDLGDANVGVALSDPLGIFAQPVKSIRYQGRGDLLNQLAEVVEKEKPALLVAGLPLDKNGELGKNGEKIKQLAEFLAGELKLPLEMIDERFSSQGAQVFLQESHLSRHKQKAASHSISASLILQIYLDRRKK